MGLGFTPISSIGASPWWETLAKGGSWAQPLFGFYLTRYVPPLSTISDFCSPPHNRYGNDPIASENEPGGSMDIGYENYLESLCSGAVHQRNVTYYDSRFINSSFTNINYISLTSQSYWDIPVQSEQAILPAQAILADLSFLPQGVKVGSTQLNANGAAAIDTGTTLST